MGAPGDQEGSRGRGESKAEGYRVIPLLLPGITTGALGTWFDEEPLAVPIEVGPVGLSGVLPALLAALGKRLPTDHPPVEQPAARLLEELVLELTVPQARLSRGAGIPLYSLSRRARLAGSPP